MSFFDFAMVWRYSPAQGNAFLVHLALADMAIESRVIATQGEIASIAHCSTPTVSRVLVELIEAGEIKIETQGGGPRSPIYKITHASMATANGTLQNDSNVHPDMINEAKDHHIGIAAMTEQASYAEETVAVEAQPAPVARSVAQKPVAITDLSREDLSFGLSRLLKAMGTDIPENAPPLYWFRDEHVADYRNFLLLADKLPYQFLEAVVAAQIKAPNIRSLREIGSKLAAAKIIPF